MGETGDAIARARDDGRVRDDGRARASRVSLASSGRRAVRGATDARDRGFDARARRYLSDAFESGRARARGVEG